MSIREGKRRSRGALLTVAACALGAVVVDSWGGDLGEAAVRAADTPHGASVAQAAGDSTRAATSAAPAPLATSAKRSGFRRLETRLTLREPFNLAANKIRVIAFLSPSCPRCLMNAGQLQREILQKRDTEELAIFIVWLKILEQDNEDAVLAAMKKLPDARVLHFWDPKRLLNHWLLDAIQFDIALPLYDVFLLYDREARWEKVLPRPGYWMQEIKGAPGPKWDVGTFALEIESGLRGAPFTVPYD